MAVSGLNRRCARPQGAKSLPKRASSLKSYVNTALSEVGDYLDQLHNVFFRSIHPTAI